MLSAYRRLSVGLAPVARRALRHRERRGKEEQARLSERMGVATQPRPDGQLIWLHAASVGEALSTLPVIERLQAAQPDATCLVTTGTVTSARVMSRRLPAGTIHQYVPVDSARWVRAFLDHWRPDLAVWIESDLWPNLVIQTWERGIPMALVNARMSRRSFRNRRWTPWLSRPLVRAFGLIAAESEPSAERYRRLGSDTVVTTGNIKHAAAPLPVDDMELVAMRSAVGGRPIWVAASTHPGEETVIAEAHRLIRRKHPRVLTIIVPRHPERGAALMDQLAADDVTLRRRSRQEMPETTTGLYIADTLGELGLFYRLAEIVFVGGSLIQHGGQNPIEPAMLDSAILHGPNMENFSDVAAALAAAGGGQPVSDARSLAEAVVRLLDNPDARSLAATAARTVADGERDVIDRLMAALGPFAATALEPPAAAAALAAGSAPAAPGSAMGAEGPAHPSTRDGSGGNGAAPSAGKANGPRARDAEPPPARPASGDEPRERSESGPGGDTPRPANDTGNARA